MTEQPTAWMPRERWDALVRGDDCPLCAECQSTELSSRRGFIVADLQLSRLRLALNQYVPGYCVLICHRHVVEPYHLSAEERALFFDDLTRAAQAIERVFRPWKMNYQLLGNLSPHMHVHLVPRYYGDPAPGRPIDPGAETVLLAEEEYADRVRLIREVLRKDEG